jgi:PAS domain S-box-containing protein
METEANIGGTDRSGSDTRGMFDLRPALIRQLFAQSRSGVIASWASAVILVVMLWPVAPHEHLLIWIGLYSLAQLPRQRQIYRFDPRSISDARIGREGALFSLFTVTSAAIWGMGGALLFPSQSLLHQYIIAIFLSGISAAAAVIYSPLLECCLPSLALTLAPFSLRYFWEGGSQNMTIGLVILIYAGVLALTARHMNAIARESIGLRFEREGLIKSLRAEKNFGERLNSELKEEISRRAETQEALQVSEEMYRLLVDHANEAIVVIQEGRIRFSNSKSSEMTGFSGDELMDLEISELLNREDQDRVLDYHRRRMRNERAPYIYECKMVTKAGHEKWVESKVAMTSWNGNPAALAFVSDLTQRKEFEDKILSSLEERDLLLREAHHRVKNNLQVVISLLRLQSRRLGDEKLKGALEDCQNRIQSMAFVHEKLYQSENLSKVDFPAYLQSLLGFLRGSYNPGSNRVTVVTDIGVAALDIDIATRLGMVAGELITNSLKHAFPNNEKGAIIINVSSNNDGNVELLVEDNGVGLPEGFDLEEADTVGLRLVKAIVGQMSGAFEARPNEKGATFKVVLPSNGRNVL